MKYEVKYTFFGTEWHSYGKVDSMKEAKEAATAIRRHARAWDGKSLVKIKIEKTEG